MRQAREYVTRKEAMAVLAATIREHAALIPGLRGGAEKLARDLAEDNPPWFSVEWERDFAIGVHLSVDYKPGLTEEEQGQSVTHMKLQVELTWSSTGRSPAASMACIALYTQVAQLACLLEASAARMRVAHVRLNVIPCKERSAEAEQGKSGPSVTARDQQGTKR